MEYQKIRAALETPLLAAYAVLTPPVPVYFSNVLNSDVDSEDEFVQVTLGFGLTTEPALSTNHTYARGVLVVRVYTPKGKGAARNQVLTQKAFDALQVFNSTPKSNTGVYVRTGSIDGPTFSPEFDGTTPDQQSRRAFTPFYVSRLETSFQATVLS
jgi:hypothetical protein